MGRLYCTALLHWAPQIFSLYFSLSIKLYRLACSQWTHSHPTTHLFAQHTRVPPFGWTVFHRLQWNTGVKLDRKHTTLRLNHISLRAYRILLCHAGSDRFGNRLLVRLIVHRLVGADLFLVNVIHTRQYTHLPIRTIEGTLRKVGTKEVVWSEEYKVTQINLLKSLLTTVPCHTASGYFSAIVCKQLPYVGWVKNASSWQQEATLMDCKKGER